MPRLVSDTTKTTAASTSTAVKFLRKLVSMRKRKTDKAGKTGAQIEDQQQATQAVAESSRPAETASILTVEKAHYIFGMDWRMVPPTRRLARALAMARDEGQAWYVLSELEDTVGYLKSPKWLVGSHYAAPMHLAEQFSQGGLELFVLGFQGDKFAVVALQESRPLPGFDFLGDEATARGMAEEFLAIQRGQPIRVVGNVPWLEGQDLVTPEDLFAEPAPSARLRSLRSLKPLFISLAVIVLGVAGYFVADHFLEEQRQQTLLELQNSPSHQQKQYGEQLAQAWLEVLPEANHVMRTWYALVAGLPLRHQGWKLAKVECQKKQCLAYWLKSHGSYGDFVVHLPPSAETIDEAATAAAGAQNALVTRHPLTYTLAGEPVATNEMQERRATLRNLKDFFDDLELLGKSSASIEPAVLFGGRQNPDLLPEPVFAGPWKLRHELWVLPAMRFPKYTRVETLSIEFHPIPKDGAPVLPATPSNDTPPEIIQFEVTGSYYAKK